MKWIKISDKIPKIGERVFVYANGIIRESYLYETDGNNFNAVVEEKIFKWDYYDGCRNNKVTHWMPLPEPPSQFQ